MKCSECVYFRGCYCCIKRPFKLIDNKSVGLAIIPKNSNDMCDLDESSKEYYPKASINRR